MTNEQQAKVDQIAGARPDVTFVIEEKGDGNVLMHGTSKKEDGLAWPTIKIGKGAGIDLVEIRSWSTTKYPKPMDAALVADLLYANQRNRGLNKAAAPSGNLPAKEQFSTGEEQTVSAEDVGELAAVLGKANSGRELSEDEQIEQMLREESEAQANA